MRAFEAKIGDKLPPGHPGQTLQTVKEIMVDTDNPNSVIISTDQGIWSFKPEEDLIFPRRRDGQAKIWYPADVSIIDGTDILVTDLKVGDVVPNELGWTISDDDEPNLFEALLVTYITFGSHGTYINLYSGTSKKTRRMYVPLGQKFLHGKGCVWEDYGKKSKASAASKNPNRVPTTSGRYLHAGTTETVVFKIAGRAGRPPAGSIPAPQSPDEWAEWALLDKEAPHPEDPRDWTTDAIES